MLFGNDPCCRDGDKHTIAIGNGTVLRMANFTYSRGAMGTTLEISRICHAWG